MCSTCPSRLVLVGIVLAACWNPAVGSGEGRAVEVAAVAEIVRQIVSNPGPIEAVCIRLTNKMEGDSAVPDLDVDYSFGSVDLLPLADCEEVDGVLQTRGGGQAVSVTAREPELDGSNKARVQVLTSTGSRDVAAYRCTLRRSDDSWIVEQCELEAIT